MLMSIIWEGPKDGKCLFVLDLPVVDIRACPEQATNVDTVVMSDFGVAEFAMYIAQGSQLLE